MSNETITTTIPETTDEVITTASTDELVRTIIARYIDGIDAVTELKRQRDQDVNNLGTTAQIFALPWFAEQINAGKIELPRGEQTEFWNACDAATTFAYNEMRAQMSKLITRLIEDAKEIGTAGTLVAWIAENCLGSYPSEARDVLRALPCHLEDLEALAEENDWCGVWGTFLSQAKDAGVIPASMMNSVAFPEAAKEMLDWINTIFAYNRSQRIHARNLLRSLIDTMRTEAVTSGDAERD